MNEINQKKTWWFLFICWVLASVSTIGSLFFSEVMEFPPCVLCWYQRIAMYPLVLIFLVGAFQPAKYTVKFAIPLVVSGWIVALYHNLLHYGIVPESASPCLEGVSCSTIYLDWFGFMTIPLLSFLSFSFILTLLMIINWRFLHEE